MAAACSSERWPAPLSGALQPASGESGRESLLRVRQPPSARPAAPRPLPSPPLLRLSPPQSLPPPPPPTPQPLPLPLRLRLRLPSPSAALTATNRPPPSAYGPGPSSTSSRPPSPPQPHRPGPQPIRRHCTSSQASRFYLALCPGSAPGTPTFSSRPGLMPLLLPCVVFSFLGTVLHMGLSAGFKSVLTPANITDFNGIILCVRMQDQALRGCFTFYLVKQPALLLLILDLTTTVHFLVHILPVG
ncbi:proline-rich receptor-like protein kinase PERK9 [Dermochelys coriacea]|uniref:proline-rich receptor-like protein kinase PERK9 n=1 Tax=Dermochelys coriacea TaxID=27794 RepID=UPI0018E74F1C|nr:proline-rich receptor-like protein kinase PERK9 [Dermochelys coriacea]